MTTIVYFNNSLYSDTMCTTTNGKNEILGQSQCYNKLMRVDDVLIGFAGDLICINKFLRKFHKIIAYTKKHNVSFKKAIDWYFRFSFFKKPIQFIICPLNGEPVVYCGQAKATFDINKDFVAIGSGANYFYHTIKEYNWDPVKGIQGVSKYDKFTGGDIMHINHGLVKPINLTEKNTNE